LKIVLRILGIILVVLSLLLVIAVPPAGIIGIILGVLCIVRSNQKLADKITANIAKSREKTALRSENQDYRQQSSGDDWESLKRNMYDWIVCGDCKTRPSHSILNHRRCRFDDPTVCSYDMGTTWRQRPKEATLSHPGEEEGCRCEAHPYYIENKIEIKLP